MTRDDLVRLGAQVRLAQLRDEMAALEALVGTQDDVPAAGNTAGLPNRKPLTAAQKKAISLRMKRYWQERKKGR